MDGKTLDQAFRAHRAHLQRIAYRMLGSRGEADDAVQEAWLRLGRSGGDRIANLRGWLTTVVGRICLDMLRARAARREDADAEDAIEQLPDEADTGRDVETADSVGLALIVVLETLSPAERLAFVLHDMFDVPFDEIARILDKSPEAARQLASRARRKVQGRESTAGADRARREEVVRAFLAASREGDFDGLVALLAPDVVFRADAAAVRLGAAAELRGAEAVANTFNGRARGAVPALVDGALVLTVTLRGRLHVVLRLAFDGDLISGIEAIGDRESLDAMAPVQL